MTTEQAAALMGVSQATVLRYAKAGKLPAQKVGRTYRFIEAELAEATRVEPVETISVPTGNQNWRALVGSLSFSAA